MQPSKLWGLEIGVALLTLLFTVLWIFNKDGIFEPISGVTALLGTVAIHILRRKAETELRPQDARVLKLRGESRFIIDSRDESVTHVWQVLTRPFLERHTTWHPSYSDFEPISMGPNGFPREFEVRGSAGGRYPWRIEKWDEKEHHLRIWQGPSKKPPAGKKGDFLGLIFELRVTQGVRFVLIEISCEERWIGPPWRTREEWFENGPKREIEWIFRRFPIPGEIEYVREAEPEE
jgi:hypothetical protein